MKLVMKVGEKPKVVPSSKADNVQRDIDAVNELASKPLRDWKISMQATDTDMPRYVEDIMDALTPTVRDKIATFTLDNYNNKKALRLTKPE